MSTRSSSRNLFPPLGNPEITIRRRSRIDPTLLNNSKMAAEGLGDLPASDLRTMEELCQPSLNGTGGPIAPIAIQAMNFGLKNDMIQQVHNSCQFHGLPSDDANKHLDKFLHVTQSIKVNGVTDDALRNSYQPQGNRNLFSYRSDNYLGPPGINQNQNRNNQNHNFQNQNRNQGNHNPQGNNQGRNQFFQGANQGQNQSPAYQAPVHQPQSPLPQVVTTNEFTNFMKANDAILKNMQTNMTSLINSNLELKNMFGQFMKMNTASSLGSGTLPVTSSIIEPVASPVSATRPNQRPSIPYSSRLHDQKLRDKANDQREKIFQIFKDLNFNISFADALILMPKFDTSIKSLLTNKDKFYELARTPLNEYCSAVLLKKLPEKLGDPGKFLIPYDFPGMAECLALVDLGASINLMPLSVWNKLYLPDLSPTCMTLELDDHLISRSVRVAEDVFIKVGTFHFPADFVVVDFYVDPRVPLILERSFLKTGRALIDVFEEYLQEVLGFSDVIASGNPTPYYDPIVSTTSLTLTPFRNSDFLLEEVDAFLALEDDPTSSKVDQAYVDTEGDILLLESFMNDVPSLLLLNQGNYLPEAHKELKIYEAKTDKSSIDEPLEVELIDLPPHLEYAFLEGDDKFAVIIAKDLSVEEKTALITILKSHNRAIAWKLSDIKGIDPEFCTHKILMEEDFKPTVQHQRRVNP
nr:hypothetical protein [Tanacetum cinerariifolium]